MPFNQLGHPVAGAATRFIDKEKGFGASGETCSDGGGGAGKSFGRVPLQGPPPLTEGTPGHHVGDTQFGTRGSPKTFVSDS